MPGRAKTLDNEELIRLLEYVAKRSAYPLRDTAAVLLSFKAGLRVGEIAGLSWGDVTTAFGELRTDKISVPNGIAKKGRGREVPMHQAVYAALAALRRMGPQEHIMPRMPLIRAAYDRHNLRARISPNTLQRYMSRLYEGAGLYGVTSHSGRRSFITALAREANKHGCSLRDVQNVAGHAFINTTEAYIDPSDKLTQLVRSV